MYIYIGVRIIRRLSYLFLLLIFFHNRHSEMSVFRKRVVISTSISDSLVISVQESS